MVSNLVNAQGSPQEHKGGSDGPKRAHSSPRACHQKVRNTYVCISVGSLGPYGPWPLVGSGLSLGLPGRPKDHRRPPQQLNARESFYFEWLTKSLVCDLDSFPWKYKEFFVFSWKRPQIANQRFRQSSQIQIFLYISLLPGSRAGSSQKRGNSWVSSLFAYFVCIL